MTESGALMTKHALCAALGGPRAIYVVEAGDLVKVGVSNNVASRVNMLQVGNPHHVRVAWCARGETKEINRLEKAAHHRLYELGHHFRGEWFSAVPEVARDAILEEAARLRIRLSADIQYPYLVAA